MTVELSPLTAGHAHDRGRSLLTVLLILFVLSIAGNLIGSILRYPNIGSAVLFPPYAVLTAALAVSPRRHWIWLAGVSVLAHVVTFLFGWPLSWLLLANVANTARALAAALLLTWFLSGLPRLDGVKALLLFAVAAVVLAPAVGATIGAANVVLHRHVDSFWTPWMAWYVSSALTGLTMIPAMLVVFAYAGGRRRARATGRRVAEAALLALALAATCGAAFLGNFDGPVSLPLYALFPVLIWAALRFGAAGASAALTVAVVVAIWGVDRGVGPFRAPVPEDNVYALQMFMLFTSAFVLCLAGVAAGRKAVVDLHGALLASVHDQVAVIDADGEVIETSDSWRRFAERSDVPAFDRVHVGDRYLALCQAVAGGRDGTAARIADSVRSVLGGERRRVELEYDHRHHDAVVGSYTISVEALARAEGGAVVTRADVTARRQAQHQIDEQRREVFHLARVAVLGQLSGAIAHELNQPLTAILSNAEAARMLLRQQGGEPGEIAEILRDIIAEDRRAAAVVERLHALLRRGERHLQDIHPKELVDDVLGLAHAELVSRRVDAVALVEPYLEPLCGDKVQLQQVLLNLILNGCEAMAASPSPRRLVVAVGADPAGGVRLTVRDHGAGIAPDLLERLFEPFVTTKPSGLGLGLSIARSIVAAHGGRLWAENNADAGATVHCFLPVVAGPTAPAIHSTSVAGAVEV